MAKGLPDVNTIWQPGLRRVAASLLILVSCLLAPVALHAQTLRFIVPFEPGSAPDVYARVVSQAMGRALNRVTIVENKPGAVGNIGAQYVAREPADGSTIMVGTAALCEINPLVFDNLRWSMADFTPLIRGVQAPLVLVTNPSVPAKTLDELVAWVRKNPGKLNYASYSAGAPGHFLGAKLNEVFGLDLTHVPYGGSATQVTALLGGQALMGFAQTQSTLAHIQSGALNAIAITSEERFGPMSNVPTFSELGHPEMTTQVWFGLLVRAATPPDTVKTLLAASVAAQDDPAVRQALIPQGYDMPRQSGEAFAQAISAGTKRWAALVKATGFKASQ